MKKGRNGVLLLIAILMLLIVGIYLAYDRLYYPSAKTYATYLAVHQEIDKTEADTFFIQTTNHKVIIKASEDDKIKIIYYQKSDNANVAEADGRKYTLKMAERVENLDNLLFKSEKKIDTITIYLPVDKQFDLNVRAIDGNLIIDGVGLRNLTFENAYGDLSISNCTASSITAQINNGKITISDSGFSRMDLNLVAGEIALDLQESLAQRGLNLKTTYGNIYLNGQMIYNEDEQGNKTVANEYVSEGEKKGEYIKIVSTRSKVYINSIEPEVPEENNETTEETPQ